MNILITIVHYWDPNGGGSHQSLRPNPNPRIQALQQQLLSLRRLGYCQSLLHMKDHAVYRTNDFFRNNITIKIVTDGSHHVLNFLTPEYKCCFDEVIVSPAEPKMLGFEAHKILENELSQDYDMYGYLEDDLIISDPTFFAKIQWFESLMGPDALVLPQRVEFSYLPHAVDKFFIDGPLSDDDLPNIPNHGATITKFWGDIEVPFESPLNPHAGCFFLTSTQLKFWKSQAFWQDFDVSFISPLESAATLGIVKAFKLFKPCFSHASWLEIQHYGDSFHSLIA